MLTHKTNAQTYTHMCDFIALIYSPSPTQHIHLICYKWDKIIEAVRAAQYKTILRPYSKFFLLLFRNPEKWKSQQLCAECSE